MKTKKPALAHGFILSIVLLLNSLMPIIIQDYKTSFFSMVRVYYFSRRHRNLLLAFW